MQQAYQMWYKNKHFCISFRQGLARKMLYTTIVLISLLFSSCRHPMAQAVFDEAFMLLYPDLSQAVASKFQLESVASPEAATQLLEKMIDEYDNDLPALKNFILPAGGLIANHYHILRTICRRSERRAAEVDLKETTSEPTKNCLIYLNRLSDLFFVLARWNNWILKITDTAWDKEK